jgi:hypothetical protein
MFHDCVFDHHADNIGALASLAEDEVGMDIPGLEKSPIAGRMEVSETRMFGKDVLPFNVLDAEALEPIKGEAGWIGDNGAVVSAAIADMSMSSLNLSLTSEPFASCPSNSLMASLARLGSWR